MFRRLSSINIYCHSKNFFENVKRFDRSAWWVTPKLQLTTVNPMIGKKQNYELPLEIQCIFVFYKITRDAGRISWEREKMSENIVQLKRKYLIYQKFIYSVGSGNSTPIAVWSADEQEWKYKNSNWKLHVSEKKIHTNTQKQMKTTRSLQFFIDLKVNWNEWKSALFWTLL